MLIDLPIQEWSGWKVVKAEIVDVAPHLSATFAIHRDPWGYKQWRVSHAETGAFLSIGNTRQQAINDAIKRCQHKTNGQLAAAVRKQCAEYRRLYGRDLTTL